MTAETVATDTRAASATWSIVGAVDRRGLVRLLSVISKRFDEPWITDYENFGQSAT
jgi:hypothetical protein